MVLCRAALFGSSGRAGRCISACAAAPPSLTDQRPRPARLQKQILVVPALRATPSNLELSSPPRGSQVHGCKGVCYGVLYRLFFYVPDFCHEIPDSVSYKLIVKLPDLALLTIFPI